jgi:dual specificity tyrosine-phosphorylation-regulated kinase 2/3/4
MPPLQIAALPPATTQRLANLKSGSPSSLSSSDKTPKSSTSRATGQTVSSMQKQSDASLRSQRNTLPTIAGSPSVGTLPHHGSKEPPSVSTLNASSLSKETPTKIPRISSRSSAVDSPTLKGKDSARRGSLIVNNVDNSRQSSPATANECLTEFGVLVPGQTPKATASTSSQRHSVRASPSVSNPRVPRQLAGSSTVNGISARKNRESISFSGLRKSSTGSVTSINPPSATGEDQPSHSHRFSALSPSKLKLLSPKISLPVSRGSSSTQSISQTMASPSITRQPTTTPSPVSSLVDEEEMVGDEEMLQYIKRQQTKKLAAGATQAELDKMLRFPEPIAPTPPASPACASCLHSSFSYANFLFCFSRSQKQPSQLSI